MALHLSQQLRQTQRLVMTPQMQQSIQLLQMNVLELEQHLDQELKENPFLEIGEDGEEEDQLGGADSELHAEPGEGKDSDSDSVDAGADAEKAVSDGSHDDSTEVATSDQLRDQDALGTPEQNGTSPEEGNGVDIDFDALFDDSEPRLNSSSFESLEEVNDFTTYTAIRESLYDHLERQLELSVLNGKEREVAHYIIGLLDEDGYLKTSIEDIAEEFGMEPCDVEDILQIVQQFEPTGIGARSIEECLTLQLEELGVRERDVYRVVNNHFKLLQTKKFKEAAKASGLTEDRVREIFNDVVKLNPHPARSISRQDTHYIRPDVYVKEIDGEYLYFVHEGRSGRLRLNKFYRDLLRNKTGAFTGEEKEFALSKLKSAQWLIKNIEKRKGTVLRVTEAIMQFQRDFLDRGVEGLHPLTLKEIAAMVDMHESTIARVTTGKYVETPRGTFELKYFFSSGLETESGEDASSRSIKERIKQIIGEEEPKRPLSDQKIANILQDEGLHIARRTVAKYREQMKFLPAKLRKAV